MRSAIININILNIFAACVAVNAVMIAQPRSPLMAVVSGTVLDPSEGLIEGAAVILSSGDRDLLRTNSDSMGEFRFDAVAPGRYELRVGHPGFTTQQIRLNVGTRARSPLRVVLAIAALEETLNVESAEGRVSPEVSENADVIRLTPRELENLPIMDGDVIGALSRLLGPAAAGTGGVTVIVDGMPSTERISLSEIQEVRLNNNPYSAEFARPGRGRIEIITKSGSSKYHGSFYFGFRDYRLDARNAFASERPPQGRKQLDANLSGPVRHKDKNNTFSLSASRIQDRLDPNVYAFGLTGPILENATHSQTTTLFSVQYTRRIGANALSFRYSDLHYSDHGAGTGGFVLPQAGTDSTSRYHQIYSSYRATISPKLLNEFFVRVRTEESATGGTLPGVPKIVVTDAFTGGGAQVDASGTDNRLEFTDNLSWSHGRHLVKAGVNVPAFSRLGSTDRSNFNGTIYFSSLDDYAQGRPFSFVQQSGNGHLVFWEKQVSGFVQDEIKIRQNLSVATGLRYEWENYGTGYHNFAPRFSLAYAPGAAKKTVLRAGAGIFYDLVPSGAISNTLLLDGSRLHEIQLLDPNYPNPLSGATPVAAFPPNIARFSPTLRSPYTLQYSFGVERQLRKSLTFTTTYTVMRGVDLFRSRDVNAPFLPVYLSRPNPGIGVLRQIESSGGLKSHDLQTTLRGDLSRFFNGMIIYQFGRAMNDTSGIGSFPANNWDPQGEWSRASFDTRHFFYLYGTLNAGKFFKFGMIFSAKSGRPYTMTTGVDTYHNGMTNARPPGVPRNSLQGAAEATLDLRWSKDFPLHGKEGPSLVAGVDAFNLLNRVNYGRFVGNLSSPFFGNPVSAGPARRMQVSFTFKF